MGTENHTARVIQIEQIDKAPNSDNLGLVAIGGYQVVVRLQDWKVGDLAIYVQPDSVVPEMDQFKFLWEGHEDIKKYRRVTVRKFRGSWSEGLLLPLGDFGRELIMHAPDAAVDGLGMADVSWVGVDVAPLLGITHYEPPEPGESLESAGPKKWLPRTFKGWLMLIVRIITFGRYGQYMFGGSNEKAPEGDYPNYDVESLKNHHNVLTEGEYVAVTEKIHGTNARFVFKTKKFPPFGKMYAGSHFYWKGPRASNIWRRALQQNPWIEDWCRRHPDYAIYGEAVPAQKGFRYGCKDDEVKVFAFDVRRPDGTWMPKLEARERLGTTNFVPLLFEGPYNSIMTRTFADGKSMVYGADHIREGCVITPEEEREVRGLGRVQLKVVSNAFLKRDSEQE